MSNFIGKAHEDSVLYKELKATEEAWEKEEWFSSGKTTPFGMQC